MRKIIKASAGTGKTYTLSLEYINILLSNPSVSFEEIVVITFTKKATAEIRERIFEHLKAIKENKREDNPVVKNLKKLNENINFENVDKLYAKLLLNKDKIRITTIDSFVNSIFKSVIAPFLNISDYEIDPEINEKYLSLIFNFILNSQNRNRFETIFKNFKAKSMSKFNQFIKTVIDLRWIFDFSQNAKGFTDDPQKYYNFFIDEIKSAFDELANFLTEKDKNYVTHKNSTMNNPFWEFMQKTHPIKTENLSKTVLGKIEELTEQNRLRDYDFEKFIHKSRAKAHLDTQQSISNKLRAAKEYYTNYIFLTQFKEEHYAIIELAKEILKFYDKLKFKNKIFTYSDISYYTFKYLNTEFNLSDSETSILQLFYEKLSYNTRFMLIDEFQDTDIIQWNILNPIIKEIVSGSGQKEYGGTIIVGDEKQAIYGWRGGERDLLINSSKFISDAQYISLDTSYRSKKLIVDFINRLFGGFSSFDLRWQYRDMKYVRDGGYIKVQFTNLKKKSLTAYTYYEKILKENLFPILDRINLSETAIIARTNNELGTIASVLKHNNIKYILESNSNLTDFHLIKSILHLLKFITRLDFFSLTAFLRSDVILASPNYLTKVFNIFTQNKDASINDFFSYNADNQIISKIMEIYHLKDSMKISDLIGKILTDFAYFDVFQSDIDFLNLNYFLEIVYNFEENNTEYPKDLQGFLRYLFDNAAQFKEMNPEEGNAIKLMTIHKSKGLGFDTVFYFGKLVKRGNPNYHDLNVFYRFNSDYTAFYEFYVTLNFLKIINNTTLTDISDFTKEREYYEEINNLYVALTRAKNNLFVFWEYSKKDGIKKAFEAENQPAIALFENFYKDHNFIEDEDISYYEEGILSFENKDVEVKPETDFENIKSLINFTDKKIETTEIDKSLFHKFVTKPVALWGTVAHYYLSFIKFDIENERKIAYQKTITAYGSILDRLTLDKIIEKTDEFILQNGEYFSNSLWDKVLCEYSIYDNKGKEFRIDRLLIKDKKILILDYKTGENYDKNQLENYKKIVSSLYPDYLVETKYLEVSL